MAVGLAVKWSGQLLRPRGGLYTFCRRVVGLALADTALGVGRWGTQVLA